MYPFVVVSGSFFFLPSFAPHNLILSFVSLCGGVHLLLLFAFICLPSFISYSFHLSPVVVMWLFLTPVVKHAMNNGPWYITYLFTSPISKAMSEYQSLYSLCHSSQTLVLSCNFSLRPAQMGDVAGGTIDRTQWQWLPPHAHARRWDKRSGTEIYYIHMSHMGIGNSIAGAGECTPISSFYHGVIS